MLAMLVGCASDGGGSASTTAAPTTTLPLADAAPVETAVSLDGAAMAMAVRPGDEGAVYLAIRRGTVVRAVLASGGSPAVLSDPLVDFRDEVSTGPEQGLLGLAFSLDGNRLYVSYNDRTGDSVLEEYRVSGARGDAKADPSRRREVPRDERDIDWYHNGGNLDLRPRACLC